MVRKFMRFSYIYFIYLFLKLKKIFIVLYRIFNSLVFRLCKKFNKLEHQRKTYLSLKAQGNELSAPAHKAKTTGEECSVYFPNFITFKE